MRWERQRAGAEDAPQLELPGLPGVVRSVRTPEFAGVVFHEVMAKSLLNRIGGGGPMPFEWTVNPYRGCTHACAYCLVGDTPVLLADGRVAPISELRVGDRVYGTERVGAYRRFVATEVLDHWSTVKPAYRVTLRDGTRLVTSGDHRFLTERGWKHVTDATDGGRRPHLTTRNSLLGTGSFAQGPKITDEHRAGYVCGVVRGSGRLRPRIQPRAEGSGPELLAVAPDEALRRAAEHLERLGVPTTRAVVRRGSAEALHAEPAAADTVRDLMRWPDEPHDDWHTGFLAGIVDVRGSHAQVLRVTTTNEEIIARTAAALTRLGFDHVVEPPRPRTGVMAVRLRGGLVERLRLIHTIDPAVTRRRTIDGVAIKTSAQLGVVSIDPLGVDLPMFDITTGTGDFVADGVISHNCFARNTHTYLDLDAGADFDSQVVVKVNAPAVLARELRSPRWQRHGVAMGTNTDPYQRAEGRYRLMPGIVEALVEHDTPFSILTKGTLLGRDLPLLVDAAERVDVGLGVSIAMLDHELSASVEHGTPSPRARLDLVRRIVDAGLPCHVLVAPVLPGLTDGVQQLDALLGEIAATGVSRATVLALHLRPGAREWYRAWLDREHPDLAPRYARIYGRGSYASKDYRAWLARRVGPLVRKHGLHRGRDPAGDVPPGAARFHAAAAASAGPPDTAGRAVVAGSGAVDEARSGSPPAAEQLTLL